MAAFHGIEHGRAGPRLEQFEGEEAEVLGGGVANRIAR